MTSDGSICPNVENLSITFLFYKSFILTCFSFVAATTKMRDQEPKPPKRGAAPVYVIFLQFINDFS